MCSVAMAAVAIILTAVGVLLSSVPCVRAQEELLTQEDASGSAVVLLAIARIQQSGIFGDDNDLLRRIAYVETRDGTAPDTFRDGYDGGIWAVDEAAFTATQDTAANKRLLARLQEIKGTRDLFNIDWQTVRWSDLRKPIYSALAARLVLFTASSAIPSTNDLEAQAEFWIANYNMDGAAADFVAVSSGLEGSILESAANEFFLGFSRNLGTPTTLQLFITTAETNPVDFVVTAAGFFFTGVAMRNSSTLVTLPSTLRVEDVDDREKGIYVKADGDKKIVVYGLSYHEFSSDAFLALPCSRLAVDEYEYYAISYSIGFQSTILIVACEDNTVFTTPSQTFTLDRLQTYVLENTEDITGTRVTSDKPIAFFSNEECTNIPVGSSACDHITEQLPPTSTWGSFFMVASLLGRNSGEIFRMVAGQDSASVVVNCSGFSQPEMFSISTAGDWEEFQIDVNNFCSVESSVPLLLSQFGLGNIFDGIGDPFHMMIPPVQQYSNNYVFNVLESFSTNYITIYVAPEHFQPDSIFVDNITLSSPLWSPVYCTERGLCGYITRVGLAAGEHQLFHLDAGARVGVSAYGFNSFNSYGYPGGLKLIPVQLSTVSFEESTFQIAEESGLSVAITVTRSGDIDREAIVLVASDNIRGTASVLEDFLSLAEIVVFQPGETEKAVTVSIRRDSKIERNETFELYLTAGAGVHLSPFPRIEITIVNDDGMITLEPSFGSMLGGTGVMVSSADISESFFKEDDELKCSFGGTEVEGVFVSGSEVLCVTPQQSETGRLVFQIVVEGSVMGEATFTSLSFTTAYNVYIASNDLMLSAASELQVQWSPQSIFPMAEPETYCVDIDLFEMNSETGEWNVLYSLDKDLPNTGMATVKLPNDEVQGTIESSFTTVVIRVTLGSFKETEITKRGVSLFQRILRLATRLVTAALSPMRFLAKLGRQAVQRAFCEVWSATQPDGIGQEILNRVPPCPLRIRDILTPSSGFVEERLSTSVPLVGDIQEVLGTSLIDDQFRQFFHPGTDRCFRQRVNNLALTGGSGQQCCYDASGMFLPASRGGGTVDKVSPSVSFGRHILCDVVPFLLCCKAGLFSDCEEYIKHRPSGQSVDYSPPPPAAIAFGDPHIITLDGLKYTFNGKGEYILIDMLSKEFSLQGRMEAVNNQGTVFTALVGRQSDSDAVQFEIIKDGAVTAAVTLVNGEVVDFTFIKEYEFNNVTVADGGNKTFSAAFSSGVFIQVRESNDFFSALAVSLPLSFKDKSTRGLMGSFNGNSSDDLLPNLASQPLSVNATAEEIHELFGITWITDSPVSSLFTYQPGESWASYYDPFFSPVFEPVFKDDELELKAMEVCGDDKFCLFDIAATERVEIGQATLTENQAFDEMIMDLQTPIVCEPPCANGVCVENDTCVCEAGFTGPLCNIRDFSPCGGNPCQNGGSCLRQGLRIICRCPLGFSGEICEFPKTCTISEPLQISPFNGNSKYSLKGTCEYIALSSCDGSPDFSVTVDFLTGSLENGAIGITKDGQHWISREDGTIESSAVISNTSPDGDGNIVISYRGQNVLGIIGSGFNRLEVADGINVVVTHQYEGNAFFQIQVSNGSLLETCGLCGNLNGQLLQRDGKIARFTDVAQVDAFTQSYLVEPRLQSLRPQRRECGTIRNDTIDGEPLYTVPVYTTEGVRENLCFQVYGRSNKTFNLVSDTCVNVNAYYTPLVNAKGNVISQVSVRAVDDTGRCLNIHVMAEGCRAFVDSIEITDRFVGSGVSVKTLPKRVRIAAHNCENVMLVMWALCETRADGQDTIQFVISRGLNLRQTSHGLLGQFWNVPALYEPFTGTLPAYIRNTDDYYTVSVTSASDPTAVRSFVAERGDVTWNKLEETCLYAGNSQGGSVIEVDEPNDPVIEGSFKEYQMNGLFETDYVYAQFEEDRCLS